MCFAILYKIYLKYFLFQEEDYHNVHMSSRKVPDVLVRF
jgi:hypothetical protein